MKAIVLPLDTIAATTVTMANIKMILGWLVAITLLTSVEGYVLQAHAMPPASPALASLLLARTCVKEAGWEITDDCAAIHAVVQKRADMEQHTYYEQMLERYSKPSAAKPWLQELDVAATRPASWPAGAHWEGVHEVKWRAMLAHAQQIVGGKVVAACDPAHWGDRLGDHVRAVNAGWTEIACGDTRNEFWKTKGARWPTHQPEP